MSDEAARQPVVMAGVVRRDGLREEAARAIANANNGGLTEHEPDEGDYYLLDKVLRILGLDAVPDVPPDPPAADRDELVIGVFQLMDLDDPRPMDHAREWVDAMFAEGVLVDAADVRARAQVDTLRELADFFMRRDGPGYVVEEICRRIEDDRAVSEREGTTT